MNAAAKGLKKLISDLEDLKQSVFEMQLHMNDPRLSASERRQLKARWARILESNPDLCALLGSDELHTAPKRKPRNPRKTAQDYLSEELFLKSRARALFQAGHIKLANTILKAAAKASQKAKKSDY